MANIYWTTDRHWHMSNTNHCEVYSNTFSGLDCHLCFKYEKLCWSIERLRNFLRVMQSVSGNQGQVIHGASRTRGGTGFTGCPGNLLLWLASLFPDSHTAILIYPWEGLFFLSCGFWLEQVNLSFAIAFCKNVRWLIDFSAWEHQKS